jgi:iron(III)-enterobactin esterase
MTPRKLFQTPATGVPPLKLKQSEYSIGPEYTPAPESKMIEGVPQGTLYEFTMDSKDSNIYPGRAKNTEDVVPYQRKVAVYVPAQLNAPNNKKPAPFMVIHDGEWYKGTVVKFLNNLIHQKRIPAMIGVFVHNGGGDSLGSQRGMEYDEMSGQLALFIETEVLPRITRDYGLQFSKDPNSRATMGGSSGGSAALSMAWYRPDLYHRVLTYSGTYVNQQWPVRPETPHGAWEYHDSLIPKSKRKPIRIWLEVSENDNGSKLDEASYHNWVMANERMAKVLREKGYEYRYVFAKNAGHTDGRVTNQTLGDGLEWLWYGHKK